MNEDIRSQNPIYCVIVTRDDVTYEGWAKTASILIPDMILIQPSAICDDNAWWLPIHIQSIASIFPTYPPEHES